MLQPHSSRVKIQEPHTRSSKITSVEGEIVSKAFKISSMRVATQESQGDMRFKDNDLKIKIQDHRRANNESKEFPRSQGSKFKEGFI
nr:hypothetical protein [Tanacetum cinerariifolium]